MLGTELPMRATTSAWGLLGVGVCSRQGGFHFPAREEEALGPHPHGEAGLEVVSLLPAGE